MLYMTIEFFFCKNYIHLHTNACSLEFASPATVSRCGMLYMSDEALEVKSLVAKWLVDHTSEAERGVLYFVFLFFSCMCACRRCIIKHAHSCLEPFVYESDPGPCTISFLMLNMNVLWHAGQMETWIKDYFYRAYEWGLNRPSAVETTKVCFVRQQGLFC